MRIALISDIHGNGTALDAVLQDINKQNIDNIIFLGDLATLGPHSAEVVERIRSLNCPCILGNHESAMFEPHKASDFMIPPHLVPTIEWNAAQLSASHLEWIRSFKDNYEMALPGGRTLLCYHGSPKSNIDPLLPETSLEKLEHYFYNQTAYIMAGGHTHVQMLRQYNGRPVINPGSVGSAFLHPIKTPNQPSLLPWAEYAILDCSEESINIDLRRLPFDLDAYIHALDTSDIPLKEWWMAQYRNPHVKW